MPFTSKFLNEKKIVITTWAGQPKDNELIHFYMSLYNHAHWQSDFREIIDLREANLANISDDALSDVSEMTTQALQGNAFRLAIIAPSILDQHLGRLYEAFTHVPNEDSKVFHHMSEAIDWLQEQNVSPPS